MDKIKSFQTDERTDIIVLDNTMNMHDLCYEMDKLGLNKVKCYAMRETSRHQLVRYFHLLYRSCENALIVD